MQVGYYRFPYDNPKTRRINAITYQYYGMELICFGPDDVNVSEGLINGQVFKEGKWVEKSVKPPLIINNSPFKRKSNEHIYDFLNKNSYMMFTKYGDKETLNTFLSEDNKFNHFIIPTVTLESFASIISALNKYSNIIIKPRNGSQGRNIFSIKKFKDNYIVTYEKKTNNFNVKELEEFYKNNFNSGKYIIQKLIQSNTLQDQPFDIRVQFEKNGKGKWVRAQSYVRLGNSEGIVSNVSKGGSIIRLTPFLRAHYGTEWKKHYEKIKQITKNLPNKVEEIYNANITSLAFDFGFENGNLYLFEVNYFPGGTFARGEIAMLRAAYTRYLLKEKFNKTIKYTVESDNNKI